MGYQRGGTDITTRCDLSYSGDTRTKATINTSKFWFGGNTRAINFADSQFLTYHSGYRYSLEGLGGVYQKTASGYTAAQKGYRPGTKSRWNSTTAGTVYLNKFSDGEIWMSSTNASRTGTRICTTNEDFNYVFFTLGGAGGGGGCANLTASAGGGGGGGYAYACVLTQAGRTFTITIGAGGARGEEAGDGSGGGNTSILISYPTAQYAYDSSLTAYGGGAGYAGGNSSGNGGSGGSTNFSNPSNSTAIYSRQTKNGGAGGQRNNSGTTSSVNFTNYSPEAQTITYLTGSGGGNGGSSGGGGGGGCPLGNGGAAVAKEAGKDGMVTAGGGGGSYQAFNRHPGGKGGNGQVIISY